MFVSLRVFKGLRVLRCVCVVCLVGMFCLVSCVLVFGDVNVEQQTSPFFSRCHAPSSQPWVFVLHVLFHLGCVRFVVGITVHHVGTLQAHSSVLHKFSC